MALVAQKWASSRRRSLSSFISAYLGAGYFGGGSLRGFIGGSGGFGGAGARRPAPPQAKQMGMHTLFAVDPPCAWMHFAKQHLKPSPLTSQVPDEHKAVQVAIGTPIHPTMHTMQIGANRSPNGSTKLMGEFTTKQ